MSPGLYEFKLIILFTRAQLYNYNIIIIIIRSQPCRKCTRLLAKAAQRLLTAVNVYLPVTILSLLGYRNIVKWTFLWSPATFSPSNIIDILHSRK